MYIIDFIVFILIASCIWWLDFCKGKENPGRYMSVIRDIENEYHSTPCSKGNTYCPTRQPGHLAVKSKTEIFNYISKQKSSEEHLCQLDANETKPFWDGENRFNFFFTSPVFCYDRMTYSSFSHSSKRMTDDPMKVKYFSNHWCCFRQA